MKIINHKMITSKINNANPLYQLIEESLSTMLASEEVLKKDWDNKYDKRWDNIR